MNRPINNVDFHYQRAVLRRGSDNKLRANLWLIRTPEQLAFVEWGGLGWALRMALILPLFLILLIVPVVTGALLFGIVGALLLGVPALIGSVLLLIWAGTALIPKPKPETFLKKAVYVIPRANIAKVSLASDYRDAVLIVQHDGTADVVHVQGRDQLVHALNLA